MRIALALLVAALGAVALGASAPAQARLHACKPVRVDELHATRIRTEYRCPRARAKLVSLLGKGVAAIPPSKAGSGRWGCSGSPAGFSCAKSPRHGRPHKRIRFRLTISQGPPGGVKGCVDRWNRDGANRALFGSHLYGHHGVRRLWVFNLPSGRCAFVAVVPATDAEFGNDGQVSVPGGGWAFLVNVPELGDPRVVQTQAAAKANATLRANYSVRLDRAAP